MQLNTRGSRLPTVLIGIAGAALTWTQPMKAATTFTFKDVNYSYTVAGTTRTGTLSGSFVYDNGTTGGVISSPSSLKASSSPYVDSNGQNTGSDLPASYIGGRVLALSGTTQTLVLWGGNDIGKGIYDYGISLTFASPLQQVNGQASIISFTSTGNDNFCNKVDSNSTTNFCTSQKNNITSINGNLVTPSPAVGLGLGPLSYLVWRRRQRRNTRSYCAATAVPL